MQLADARLQALGLAQKFDRLAEYADHGIAARASRDGNILPFRRTS